MSKIFVFDMGNVIIGEADLYTMYIKSGAECDYNTFYNLFYKSNYSKNVYEGKINDDEFFSIIINKCKINKTIEELKRIYLICKSKVYRDTLNIINALKKEGNKVYLLSNLKEIDYRYLCSQIDIKIFNELFLSYKMGQSKPDKEIFKSVINKLGTNDFYFFDDSIDNVRTAKSEGIKSYQVTGNTIKTCFQKKLEYKIQGVD